MLSVFTVSLILSLVFFVVSGIAFGDSYSTKYVSNKLKNRTDDYVEALVMNGLTSLFNRYESSGGLSRGRLGGIGSVAPDYETDLKITFVPETTNIIYLRAFVGNIYQVDRFSEDRNSLYPHDAEPFHVFEGEELRTMQIENVGADEEYFYMPYHTVSVTGDSASESTLTFIPEPLPDSYPINDVAMQEYSEYVFANYLFIPEELVPVLEDVARKADLIVEERGSEGMLLICHNLQEYFEENYRYSLQPGRTPLGADVVEYFLTKQDRGYCMHFASASTLLLRYAGIPARYCEGYILKPSDLAEGVIVSEENGKKTVEVELTDASAHAWVEIYIPNYGWIPYEMTPPSFGEDEDVPMTGLMGILSGLFSRAQRDEAEGVSSEDGTEGKTYDAFGMIAQSLEFLVRPLGYSMAIIILILLSIPVFRYLIVFIRIISYRRKGKYSEAILVKYKSYTAHLIRKKLLESSNADSVSVAEELSGNYDSPDIKDKIMSVALIVREAAFSGREITSENYEKAVRMMKEIKKANRQSS